MVAGRTPECLDEERIAAFVAGQLDASELPRVEAHVASCAWCQRLVADAAYGAIAMTERMERMEPAPVPRSKPWANFVPAAGEMIANKYRIEAMLGHGGMGAVLAARHVELGHRVAIKILHHGGQGSEARLLREAQTCAQLTNDHIARVFDVGRLPGGDPYIVMEYLAGEDLSKVASRGPLRIGDAVGFVMQACTALIDAHAAGIVHRDLKPANLFLTTRTGGTPLVKVLDFGISKMVGEAPQAWQALTSTGIVLGSPQYMSPEQIRAAQDLDVRTDIWSLGVILYELILGRPPFLAPTFSALCVAIATEEAPAPSALRQDIPPGLAQIIQRCLAKDRAARFASAADLMAALAPFEALGKVSAMATPAVTNPAPIAPVTGESSVISQANQTIPGLPSRRRSAAFAVAIALVVGLFGSAAVVLVRVGASPEIPEAKSAGTGIAAEDAGAPLAPSAPPVAPSSKPPASAPAMASSAPVPTPRPPPPRKKRADGGKRPVGPTDTPD